MSRPPAIPTAELPRLGDFEGRALVHAFEPRPGDVAYGQTYFGLVESELWPYGAVRTESGRWYAYFRTINGRSTTGLVVMGQEDGPLVHDARSAASYHGAMVREVDADDEVCAADGGDAFRLRFGATVAWHEEGVLDLSGPCAGPGLQMFNAWREPGGDAAALLHAHLGYEVHGTVFGERASGYLGLARAYLPFGVPWQTPSRFGPAPGLCSFWLAFLNVYEDGSSERGMFAHGGAGNAFRFATVVGRDGWELSTDRVEADATTNAGRVDAVDFHVGDGQQWQFRSGADEHLVFGDTVPGFADEDPTGYHVTLGTMRRAGDSRVPTVQVAWIEGFPETWSGSDG